MSLVEIIKERDSRKYGIQRRKLRSFNSDVCFPNIAFDAPAYEMKKGPLASPLFSSSLLSSAFPSANQDPIQYLTNSELNFHLPFLSSLSLPEMPNWIREMTQMANQQKKESIPTLASLMGGDA